MIRQSSVSRRHFLRLAGGSALAATAAACAPPPAQPAAPSAPTAPAAAAPATAPTGTPAPVATAAPAATGGATLKLSWWGEQEAPGLEAWLKESIGLYAKQSGNTVEPTLQDTSVVISEFQTASAAKSAPDMQYFWNGIYHMESVWQGYIEPLDGLIAPDLLKASNATVLSVFEGKQYRLGWYAVPLLWVYNKEHFSKAKLDADKPPKTWDELLAACEALKTAGITPMTGGLKDGPWGEWYMGHGLGQNLDSPAEALNLFAGQLDWREPKYWEHWAKLEQLWKAGYLNNDMNSIDLYPGIDLFGAGKGAMTQIVGPLVPKMQKMLGDNKVGAMTFPVWGKGKMAGKPIADTQGLGISSQSKNKEAAADFLKFLHAPERLSAMWDQVKQFPTDSTWDGSVIADPLMKQIWSEWMHGDNVPYISNLMPTLFWSDAMFVNSQKIIAGEYNGEKSGENAAAVATKWKEQNPDLLEKYAKWAADLKL